MLYGLQFENHCPTPLLVGTEVAMNFLLPFLIALVWRGKDWSICEISTALPIGALPIFWIEELTHPV